MWDGTDSSPSTIYIYIYDESGCSATTEALLLACRRDMLKRNFYSTIILGDFNATPHKLGPVAEWIREKQWTDAGRRADWWGGEPEQWTCHARSKAKRSRIDGVVVDSTTLAHIHSFEVERRLHIPTHSVLRLELTRNADTVKRTFLRKLGSLKAAVEAKWEDPAKDKDSKEAKEIRREGVRKLKEKMDALLSEAEPELNDARAESR